MVFHWCMSDDMSPQVSRTLLSILVILNNTVVWILSTHPPTSKSSSPFNNHLVTVPKAPLTIGIIVTIIFHSFFYCLARSTYFSFFSHYFSFILWSVGTVKSSTLQIFFCCFLFNIIRPGILVEIRWSVFMWKSHMGTCLSFLRRAAVMCIYHIFVWSNAHFPVDHIAQTFVCSIIYLLC